MNLGQQKLHVYQLNARKTSNKSIIFRQSVRGQPLSNQEKLALDDLFIANQKTKKLIVSKSDGRHGSKTGTEVETRCNERDTHSYVEEFVHRKWNLVASLWLPPAKEGINGS